MKRILKLGSDCNGQSVVEFALVLPFLLLLILGMIEFGWLLNGKIILTSAAREGARVAVLRDDRLAAESAARTAVTNSISNTSLTSPTTAVPTFGETAVVNVTAKIKPLIGLYVSGDADGNVNLSARAEMRVEK